MQAIILGSAAGGGVPQWNCRCPVCRLAWAGDPRIAHRTQSSLAISADGESWLVVNASPDIRQQIAATPQLHPRSGTRHSPIAAVLLTNGDVDHVAGLLGLRERQPFILFATRQTLDALGNNRIFDVADPAIVRREPVRLNQVFEPVPGLQVDLFAVPGKVPLWLEDETPLVGAETESTIGVRLSANGRTIAYVPGCAAATPDLLAHLDGADILLFDGTLWRDDEMIAAGVGEKTGRRMGHLPVAGPDGSAAALAGVRAGRRIYVHINNTNPILVAGSEEARLAAAAGWEIGFDGMELR